MAREPWLDPDDYGDDWEDGFDRGDGPPITIPPLTAAELAAVARLVAAGDAWSAIPNDWDDHDAETAILSALADPALARFRPAAQTEGGDDGD